MSVGKDSSWQTAVLVGLGVAATAFGARMALRTFQRMRGTAGLPGSSFTSFYKGGFEDRMTHREAALILGVRHCSS